MANSVDPDQNAPKGAFDQGLYCLLSVSVQTLGDKYGTQVYRSLFTYMVQRHHYVSSGYWV